MENRGSEQKHTNVLLPRFAVSLFPLCLLLIVALPILFAGLDVPAFMDHEGRYAEVAREMLLTGDWITPHLNFAVFLNKPPLPFWLTGLTFQTIGFKETVRMWIALSGIATLIVTFLLGRQLASSKEGLLSGMILLMSGGFFLESRLLRPDMLLTLWISIAFYGILKAEHVTAAHLRTRWLCLSAISLALSVLTKGLVGVIIVTAATGATLMLCGRLSFLREIRWTYIVPVALCVILPWHLLAGFRNPGFFWDYVINQHLLFFFDQKFPRDSLPDSVLVFWGAFLGRTFPWSFFLPVALWQILREALRSPSFSLLLPPLWLGVVLLFFSLSPSRLEHYSIPALPAVALIVGQWWTDLSQDASSGIRSGIVCCVLLTLCGICGLFLAAPLLATEDWMRQFPTLQQYAISVCKVVGFSSALAGLAFWWRHTQLAFALLVCAMPWQFLQSYRALVLLEPLNSWKPIGACIARLLPAEGEVLFAASDEYQICGGLNFYSKRQLTIILPDRYPSPTYLDVQSSSSAFISKEEALRRWQEDRPIFLLIDPERKGDRPFTTLFPHTTTVGHWGDRLLLANKNFAERVPVAYDFCTFPPLSDRQR